MCATAAHRRDPRDLAVLLVRAADRLRAAGVESARLDAELLVAWAAGVDRARLLIADIEISPQLLSRLESALSRRERREPVAYIVGTREFHSMDFEVSPAVLIPRPETETLVDAAVRMAASVPGAGVVDIGTGSGAVAVSIARECPHARVVATDISAGALEVARRNAARHGAGDRVEFRRADLFEPLDGGGSLARFDLIVSNPPYVEIGARASLVPEVRDYEPDQALYGGADGLEFFRRLVAEGRRHLVPGGALMVEIGAGQAAAVSEIFSQAGMAGLDVINDLSGLARVVVARR